MNNKNLLEVSAKSKKRTKRSKTTHLVSQEATLPPKKYQMTKKKEKALLLDKIRKIVDPEFRHETWNQTVVKYKPPEYRALLNKLWPNLTALEIRSKWKNMKRMLNNIGKPDGRGGALLLTEEGKIEFKEHLLDVIQNEMKSKSFKKLRKHLVPKLQEMFARNGRKAPKEPFQKHFWSYYLEDEKNLDVLIAWKSLPRTKPENLKRDNDESFVSDMLDSSESNDNNNDNSLILEEDSVGIEENFLLEEEVKDADVEVQKVEECCFFEGEFDYDFKEFVPVDDFFKEEASIENEGFLKKEEQQEVFEGPFVDFDNEIIDYFNKICSNS